MDNKCERDSRGYLKGRILSRQELSPKIPDCVKVEGSLKGLLQYLGENADREGLVDTPRRMLQALEWMTKGYGERPEDHLKMFEDGGEGYKGILIETNIPVYSLCEHHVVPFIGVAHVAYIPDKRIIGLSKIVRMLEVFMRRLQVQERLTTQVADTLEHHLEPLGVAVMFQCRHLCMEARGVERFGVATTTTALRGSFLDDVKTREEFYHLVRINKV